MGTDFHADLCMEKEGSDRIQGPSYARGLATFLLHVQFVWVLSQRRNNVRLMTYFFSDGKIHVILNKLQKLSTDEYDGPGTANMLINTLCETLGM